MKVSKMIKELSQYDGGAEVLLDDRVLDSVLNISNIELVQTYDNKDFVLLSLDYGAQEEVLLDE